MEVKQFVMAYEADQDWLRACIPSAFTSLRPVLPINAEIADTVYLEFNTAVEGYGKRGWLNIAHWDSKSTNLSYHCQNQVIVFTLSQLTISFTKVGIQGTCPAEKDNQGCFFLGAEPSFRPSETIEANKEFCNCSFTWQIPNGAHGISTGKTLPAYFTKSQIQYPQRPFSIESFASIPCKQVLGSYQVTFERDVECKSKRNS